MLKPTRQRGSGIPSATTSEEQAWREAMDRRLTRMETVLYKLCLFLGMDPKTGKKVTKDDE